MPRYLISKCLLCGKEYKVVPVDDTYGHGTPFANAKVLYSHGLCKIHADIENKKLDKLIEKNDIIK